LVDCLRTLEALEGKTQWRGKMLKDRTASTFSSIILFLALICSVGFVFPGDTDYYLEINKGIDIFGKVYKEITADYVDKVDPEKFMRSGIDGMLGTLDPYTIFIDENEKEEVDLITTGKYGGIGVTIGLRDGKVTVIYPMEGYSAFKQGIRAGDKILEVDGHEVTGMKLDSVRILVRGEPGTEVKMKIEREGEKKPLEFVLVREEIRPKNISYAGFIGDGIAYVKLDRFSRTAGDELRQTLKDLKAKEAIKGIVLDLRDNPGGLLDIAVDVAEKFVPRGSLIVTTKGRRDDTEKKYIANEDPMLGDTPLAVLVNKMSASASEIVAGAIQDLDRGVIVGTQTFGKGLVQTIVPLSYNTSLKLTTARYYTPSGRCIQELDYSHKGSDGVVPVTPDSLRRAYHTAHGRKVYEAGGILPDTVVTADGQDQLMKELVRKAMFFKYATHYVAEHKTLPEDFRADDSLLADFKRYLDQEQFKYNEESETKVAELKEIAKKEDYSPSILKDLNQIETDISKEKTNEFRRHGDEIKLALTEELVSRYYGEEGRIRAGLKDDKQLRVAFSFLKDQKDYKRLLNE
jgi:carboxyl-terminal processing protease